MMLILCSIFCLGMASAASIGQPNAQPLNNRPIIGVLSMEVAPTDLVMYGNHLSHVAASYVKFLESAGARVVPIKIHQNLTYYQEIIQSVNGILIPGGPTFTDDSMEARLFGRDSIADGSGYAAAGATLLTLAKLVNDGGQHFPVWGICLGFQLLTFLEGGFRDYRARCSSDNQIIPLEFKPDFRTSRLFENAPQEIIDILANKNVTAHYHNYCVTEKNMTEYGMMENWRVLSTNHDFNDFEFVSTIEAKQYPFYGTIYHPEKIGFEWVEFEKTPHDASAIAMMQYYSNFLVGEARKNNHQFSSVEAEREALIYQYQPVYTGDKTIYQQVYFLN